MIVQNAPEGQPHFVIAMAEHTAFAGQLAQHFGNDDFEPLNPYEPLHYALSNHDRGWDELDARAPQDPATGLPYNLTATPLADVVATSSGSPDYNEKHHPLSGLISSMHSYGLYHGRYGLSPDQPFINKVPEEMRSEVDAMLGAEVIRQDRLRSELSEHPYTAEWADEEVVFTAYKQLQFFDTFSLYCHCQPEGMRGEASFPHVPTKNGRHVTITVTERPDGAYTLDPFPFNTDGLLATTEGRYLKPASPGADLADVLASTPASRQTVKLLAA